MQNATSNHENAAPKAEGASGRNGRSKRKLSRFLTFYGTGKTKKGMSREKFMSMAAEHAIHDLKQVGKFRRRTGGQLFFCC